MTVNDEKIIGIIGGGAAGLAAAITASRILSASKANDEWQIIVFEKNSECGKKLLATGNGKCNITNEKAKDFILSQGFFNDLGILLTAGEDGRMYPHSRQAKTVRDILVSAAKDIGVTFVTDCEIKGITRSETSFDLKSEDGRTFQCLRLIVTTGGKAGMQYGSSGDGFKFARDLGLQVTPVLPSLVPMTYGDNPGFNLKHLKGVRALANTELYIEGRKVAAESGEVQFTDYGLSGICIFNLSRYLKNAPREDKNIINTNVIIDFVPDYTEEELTVIFDSNLKAGLKGVVNEKIEEVFLKAGLDPEKDPVAVAKAVKRFTVNVNGTKGWKEAQVTSGGVSMDEVSLTSMESKKIENLFFAGEVLDYDGPSGGYNLSWAWKTGMQAGLGAMDGIEL